MNVSLKKVSSNENGINPLNSVSLPSFTMHYGLRYTGINLHTIQEKELILLLANINSCGGSSVLGDK